MTEVVPEVPKGCRVLNLDAQAELAGWVTYIASEPFEVDGIKYSLDTRGSRVIRSFIAILQDGS